MHKDAVRFYRCPTTHAPLDIEIISEESGSIDSGTLVAPDGTRYLVREGIADLAWPRALSGHDAFVRDFYDGRADVYDRFLPLTFSTFNEDENEVRQGMIDLLRLEPDHRVLEVGAGTGRDSEMIAAHLPKGELWCQDLSHGMLARNKERLRETSCRVEFSLGNATHLSFADNSFDALFQFGGVGEFSDIPRFFREAARVVKPGGRVVVGDESMPPWLRETEFAKILTFTNAQFAAPLPLEHLPVEARSVHLRWIIGGTFYLIDFDVGEGEPEAAIDFEIPGARGGTHRTRYYGQLEGVKLDTKALANEARAKLGISMHDWLDQVVRSAAEDVLKNHDKE